MIVTALLVKVNKLYRIVSLRLIINR